MAFSRAINSLSRGAKIVPPHRSGPADTIFRIDPRDYKWTPKLWAEIVAADPYVIAYQSSDALFVHDLADAPVFMMAEEAFIMAITRSPLYNAHPRHPGNTPGARHLSHPLNQLSELEDLELLDQTPVARATFTARFAANTCSLKSSPRSPV